MNIESAWQDAPHIVLVGQMFDASRTVQRVRALRALGCKVDCIATTPDGHDYETPPSLMTRLRYRLRRPADPAQTNDGILKALNDETDVVWLDAADMIRGDTLAEAKRRNPALAVVWYSEDDMMNRRLRTKWLESAIPHIDLWVTTKSFNTAPDEVPSLGVRRTLFVNNSYDPQVHRPPEMTDENIRRYGAPISFIGTFEQPRANSVLHLARAGYDVRVWGNGWDSMKNTHARLRIEGRAAYNDEFAKVVAASDINLCFLRHANRDLQTCRSIEIPGCGGFMAHEANTEIMALFRDGREAVYFDTDDELTTLCAAWMPRGDERRNIGRAAHARVRELSMDHASNATRILNELVSMGKVAAQ